MEYGENLYKLKNSDKTSFKTPIEANIMPALSSKRPEEREFVVDSGASMHIMSKKEKSSEEMDTLRRFRTLTVVLTANGEVHTHEEAQVFVQDLNLFVTVQVLEETTAVLSLGKLCEDHGYSYEWESGQKPRLTKDGKSIICKTDNFVPLVVQGLSAKSGSVSSSTSPSQDSLRREVETATANSKRFAASSSSGSLLERSDELAPRNWCDHPKTQNKNKKRDDRKNSDDPLADHLEWLEEFKKIWWTELLASAHSSQNSDLEHSTKVSTTPRKHSIYTHFPKDRNCEVCLRTNMTRTPCRRRTGEASTSCRKVL